MISKKFSVGDTVVNAYDVNKVYMEVLCPDDPFHEGKTVREYDKMCDKRGRPVLYVYCRTYIRPANGKGYKDVPEKDTILVRRGNLHVSVPPIGYGKPLAESVEDFQTQIRGTCKDGKKKCQCDFRSVILIQGCQCGGL